MLVWFAGKARKINFDHAIIFVAVSIVVSIVLIAPTIPELPPPLLVFVIDRTIYLLSYPWWAIYLFVGIFVWIVGGLLAMRVLVQVDSTDTFPKKAVTALFGLGVVGYFGYTNSVTHVAYLVFQYAVIILLIIRYEYLEDTVARTFAYLRRL